MENPQPSAIVFFADQIGAGLLSPYGNTWVDTEFMNQLASESLLFDRAVTDSVDLLQAMESVFFDSHATLSEPNSEAEHVVNRIGTGSGVQTVLVTDDPELGDSVLAKPFDRIVTVAQVEPQGMANKASETLLANFFAQVLDVAASLEPGVLLWVHSKGLGSSWDAPENYRGQFADSEDPDPLPFFEKPGTEFNTKSDSPDLMLGYQQACAGQLLLFDELLGVFMEQLDSLPAFRNGLFCFGSPRGFSLGQHGWIGTPRDLHSESIDVPLLIRYPEGNLASARSQHLVQPAILSNVLQDWFLEKEDDCYKSIVPYSEVIADNRFTAQVSISVDSQMIQTAAWKLIRKQNDTCLFAKPDDVWEVNNIADRCSEIAESLSGLLDQFLESKKSGNEDFSFELSPELVEGVR